MLETILHVCFRPVKACSTVGLLICKPCAYLPMILDKDRPEFYRSGDLDAYSLILYSCEVFEKISLTRGVYELVRFWFWFDSFYVRVSTITAI